MNWINQVLAEFGQRIGIPDLRLNEQLKVYLSFENDVKITVAAVPDLPISEILIYISTSFYHGSLDLLSEMLKKGHFERSPQFSTMRGISEKKLFTCIRIPERAFSIISLERSFEYLMRMQRM